MAEGDRPGPTASCRKRADWLRDFRRSQVAVGLTMPQDVVYRRALGMTAIKAMLWRFLYCRPSGHAAYQDGELVSICLHAVRVEALTEQREVTHIGTACSSSVPASGTGKPLSKSLLAPALPDLMEAFRSNRLQVAEVSSVRGLPTVVLVAPAKFSHLPLHKSESGLAQQRRHWAY